jgi:hypothetical protein
MVVAMGGRGSAYYPLNDEDKKLNISSKEKQEIVAGWKQKYRRKWKENKNGLQAGWSSFTDYFDYMRKLEEAKLRKK